MLLLCHTVNVYRDFTGVLQGFMCTGVLKLLYGLQGNSCRDYRDFAVQGLYRDFLLYVHASYRVQFDHRDSLFRLQGKN